jgi:hypothetical protein
MPKIELNANDVYSRLYNNYILNCRKRKRKNSKKKTNYNNNDNDDNSTNNYNNYNYNEHNQSENLLNYHQFLKNDKKKKNYKERNKRCISTVGREKGKKIIKFILKSNISEKENNKQFTLRITPQLMKECWSKFSGGPQPEDKIGNKTFVKNEQRKILNYKILSLNKKNGEKKDISLFNTMIKDDPNLESDFIKNKNYKDFYNNSSLHIAVKQKSLELVKYLLSKNCDINDKNEDGETALHIACRSGNEDIIKLLLGKGADINIKNNDGKKPFELFKKMNIQNK